MRGRRAVSRFATLCFAALCTRSAHHGRCTGRVQHHGMRPGPTAVHVRALCRAHAPVAPSLRRHFAQIRPFAIVPGMNHAQFSNGAAPKRHARQGGREARQGGREARERGTAGPLPLWDLPPALAVPTSRPPAPCLPAQGGSGRAHRVHPHPALPPSPPPRGLPCRLQASSTRSAATSPQMCPSRRRQARPAPQRGPGMHLHLMGCSMGGGVGQGTRASGWLNRHRVAGSGVHAAHPLPPVHHLALLPSPWLAARSRLLVRCRCCGRSAGCLCGRQPPRGHGGVGAARAGAAAAGKPLAGLVKPPSAICFSVQCAWYRGSVAQLR